MSNFDTIAAVVVWGIFGTMAYPYAAAGELVSALALMLVGGIVAFGGYALVRALRMADEQSRLDEYNSQS